MTLDLGDIFAGAMRPPVAPRPLRAWAQATLRLAEGDEAERARQAGLPPPPIEWTPAQLATLDAYDGEQQMIAILGDRQGGKTLSGIVAPLLYQLAEDRRPVLLAGPRVDDCRDAIRGKVIPTHDASHLDLLPTVGTGAKGGIAESMLASTGTRLYLRGAGGSNQAQQAMVTARAVLITELDSIALAARTRRRSDGDPGRQKLELLAGRADDFQAAARIVVESTIKLDVDSLIESTWHSGTRGQVLIPCPSCGQHVARDWCQISYDPASDRTAAASAVWACPACGTCHDAASASAAAWQGVVVHDGQALSDAGQAVGPLPASSCWSIRSGALENPRKSLGWLATLHRRATVALAERDDHEPLRLFTRDQLARRYTPDATAARPELTAQALAQRSAASGYARGECPFRGTVSVAIDVQLRELWWAALVLEPTAERAAIIDGRVEYICGRYDEPTKDQRIRAILGLLARLRRGFPGPDGSLAAPAVDGIDVGGGGWLDEVDAALKADRWRCWAVRGDGRAALARLDGAPTGRRIPGLVETFRRPDGRRLALITDEVKARIGSGLTVPVDQPRAVLLPRGLAATDHLCRHLCAEQRDHTGTWQRRGPRVDLLDGGTYALGLAMLTQIHPTAPRRPAVAGTIGA